MKTKIKTAAAILCKISTFLLVCIFTHLHINTSSANKLTVGDLVIDQGAQTVQFKIMWENSWRVDSNTMPYNWDAAWIFVKFRDCSADPAVTQFTHGLVSTAGGHNLDVLGDGQMFDTTKADGTSGIDASPNNTGVMLKRATLGTGTVSDTILLNITNLPTTGTYDIRVFGIEMVFIQGGAGGGAIPTNFEIGDGNGTTESASAFSVYGTCNTNLTVSSEAALAISRFGCGNAQTLTASFPKGWNGFYIMKYEITQGQYADFLNSVAEDMATNLLWTGVYNIYRNRINNTGTAPQKYSTDRTDRACNYLSWGRVTSYLDWAALRPLTELQYEKAARGFAIKTTYENATGTTTAVKAVTISGAEDGTETITTASANVCAASGGNFTGGDGGQGPLRAGIFAKSTTTTREETGGSYFGVMELSGNVSEFYVKDAAGISGNICANGISLGNGTLGATGYHNQADWPSGSAPVVTGELTTEIIRRGGNWNSPLGQGTSTAYTLQISNRGEGSAATQDAYIGGRGGR